MNSTSCARCTRPESQLPLYVAQAYVRASSASSNVEPRLRDPAAMHAAGSYRHCFRYFRYCLNSALGGLPVYAVAPCSATHFFMVASRTSRRAFSLISLSRTFLSIFWSASPPQTSRHATR